MISLLTLTAWGGYEFRGWVESHKRKEIRPELIAIGGRLIITHYSRINSRN